MSNYQPPVDQQKIGIQPCQPYLDWVLILLLILCLSGHQSVSAARKTLTVYVFLNTECPISQQYVVRLAEVYQHFSHSDVRFIAVFPLRTDTPAAIQRFRVEYKLPFAGKPDINTQLARHFRVRVTPEVVVMQSDGKVSYQGAIDNWYVDLGKHRPQATQYYLKDALTALLAGKSVVQPRTDAVGCLIE
ncbi:redoxin domain-containing protein [Spirosoma sp. SC4-14]|uniref:redoxin domain-containing protein n=1 Tax=Spirosoma sp. SC4-14 TaxID=3128900 RepID=UPI0030D60DB4